MMSINKRIQHEATQWVARTQLGMLTPEESARLEGWLEADPRHRGAFVRANVVRVAVEGAAALTGGEVPPQLNHAPWRIGAFSRPGLRFLTASIVALSLIASVGWFTYRQSGDWYVSGIGELRQVALEDGSSMILNTATKAVVRLSERVREVELPEGEALFDVAKDPTRPFLVRAGGVTVEAIGTAFAVRNLGGRIDVTVEEGVVQLVRDYGAPTQRLTADQRATVAKAQPVAIVALPPRETDRQLAWRRGRLEFDGQPLGRAVDEMNRHSHRRIVVADVQLAREPIVGVFRSTDTKGFADIAAAALGAQVVVDGDAIRIEIKSGL
jgi:transmembrane sensor